MDISAHIERNREYVRIVEGSEYAVIFVHGIVGTPRHFDFLIDVVPPNVSIYNMLLDGHGYGVRDFSRTSLKKWETQFEQMVEKLLLTHKKLFIVAHSMGTLFAIEQAIKHKEITDLFLIASPLRISVSLPLYEVVFKIFFDSIPPHDARTLSAKSCYGIAHDFNLFKYFGWIPRFIDLFVKVHKTNKIIGELKTRTFVYQSYADEVVSRKTFKMIEALPCAELHILKHSTHFYYPEGDPDILRAELARVLGIALGETEKTQSALENQSNG